MSSTPRTAGAYDQVCWPGAAAGVRDAARNAWNSRSRRITSPKSPQGGKRLLFFDPQMKWPVFSNTFDPNGREVDYSVFDRFQLNVKLDDDDFNADKLWPIKKASP